MHAQDDEERAWALAQARAFLAPPGESSVAGRQSSEDDEEEGQGNG